MRIVCIHNTDDVRSVRSAQKCVASGKQFGYDVELFSAVRPHTMDYFHKLYGLKKKYVPINKRRGYSTRKGTMSAYYIASGTTHFLLYKTCCDGASPICILEHDARFVGKLPLCCPGDDAVIQITSAGREQINYDSLRNCSRARKMAKYEKDSKVGQLYISEEGIIPHPLSGIMTMSGYIIYPGAARAMIDMVEKSGIAQADRIRKEYVGADNLYLQVPQSVLTLHLK